MESYVIGCQIIEKELTKVLRESGRDYPAVYLKPNLDNDPDALKAAIQHELDELPAPAVVLLGYGFSNGALSDFPAGRHRLVAPIVEDAICLVLGSQKRRDALLKEKSTYFITEGWLKGDNLFGEYKKMADKYGPEKAARLQKTILGGYERFLLIDTGVYDPASYQPQFEELAGRLNMAVEIAPGDLSLLRGLVGGPPWDSRFAVAEPGESLKISAEAGSNL